jgi:phospholipid/cholesterol/gamma-HCH transport system substrate-binding protein
VPALLVTAAMATAVVAGCSTTASDLPLPGTSMRGETYRVTVSFDDALNLAVGAPVKIDGVPIGRVDSIGVEDLKAVVTLEIAEDTPVATDADFRLRTTTALGELFVDVVDPVEAAAAPEGAADQGPVADDALADDVLADGAEVGLEQSSVAPTIEDTLSAASLFINGGGLGQIQTIVDETNLMIGGREDTVRDVLQRATSTASSITAMSGEIDAALVAISDASRIVGERQATIDRALVEIAPAAQVLDENTAELVDLLTSIDTLGSVVIPTIEQTRADLVSIVAESGPIFDQVTAVGPRIDVGVAELLQFIDGLDAGVPASYLNTHLLFQASVGIGDGTVIAPDPDGGPVPEVLPNFLEDLAGSVTGLAKPTPPPGTNGGASLPDLLRLLSGGGA